jgi:hypothetical protein
MPNDYTTDLYEIADTGRLVKQKHVGAEVAVKAVHAQSTVA